MGVNGEKLLRGVLRKTFRQGKVGFLGEGFYAACSVSGKSSPNKYRIIATSDLWPMDDDVATWRVE